MTSSKISPTKQQKKFSKIPALDFLIVVNLVLICLALWFTQNHDFDLTLQKYFFDSTTKTWLIDESREPIKTFIFYLFPKIIFGVLAFVLLACTLIAFKRKNRKNDFFSRNRQTFSLILLGLILIPLIAGNVKKFTNIYCPKQLEIYNGSYPYVKIFDSYPAEFVQNKKGQCFPAGHCVTGFALFILFFALRKKSHKFFALAASLTAGWTLGVYQMAKGAHFFSDTFVAMLLCFLLAALITRIYDARLQKISD